MSTDKKTIFLNYRNLLIGKVKKLQEWCPLKYPLVKRTAAFDPEKVADCSEEAAKLFEDLV